MKSLARRDYLDSTSARAKIRLMVCRILRKHGLPPDLQEEETKLVLQQAVDDDVLTGCDRD